jgi:threonine dehydrogenase-like Zn-dependent dehydrogenase
MVLAQPLATVLRALSRTRPVIGERCAVVGQGPIGLMFTYLLQRMGASQIIAIDVVPWRLDWAKRLGATHTVQASGSEAIVAVRELTAGALVDLCVEAAGATESILTAAYMPRWQGRLCLFGVPDHDLEPFPWFDVTNNETDIFLSRGPHWVAHAQTAVDMVAGDAALRDLVTPRLPWDDAPRAFEMYAHPADHPGTLKVVLEL